MGKLFPWKRQEWCVTVSPTRASVVWSIRRFSKIDAKAGDYLVSQKFEFLNATWKILIFPSGHPESTLRFVMLFLVRISSTVESQNVKCKFFYRDEYVNEYLIEEFVENFDEDTEYRLASRIEREDLLSGELRDLLLAEDTLTVCCEVRDADADADAGESEDPPTGEILNWENSALRETVSDLRKEVVEQEFEIMMLRSKLDEDLPLPIGRGCESVNQCLKGEQKLLTKALATVYEQTLFPDVTLKVEGEDLPAHKAILSGRSSVFRGMFHSNMKESREHVAEIQEMEAQTARQMLRYIYTGKVCDLEDESASSLFVAADRYDLQGLKEGCQEYLLSTISVDNVCQLALLADLHEGGILQWAVREFIRKNHHRVLQSAIWKESKDQNFLFFWELESSIFRRRFRLFTK